MVEKTSKLPDHGSATQIDRREERGGVVIRLSGPINEHFDRVRFVSASTNRVVIVDFDAVAWITSFGIREWTSAIKEIPKTYLAFINVRPTVVQQFNMLVSFGGDGELLSFYAPYACPICGHYQEKLIDLLELHPVVKRYELPAVTCESCGQPTELDDVPESYLSYAASARPPNPPPEYHEVLRGEPDKPAARHRITLEKLVEDNVTVLMLAGDLGGRASFKRAAAGLEGTVALSFSRVQTYDAEGISRLRPFWEGTGPDVLLVEVPLSLVQRLPEESWRRFKVLSLRAEMQCPSGHVLNDALIQNSELWQLVRGDELQCPSCGGRLTTDGIDQLAARGVFAKPTPEVERAVADIIERRQQSNKAMTGFAAEDFGRYKLVEMLGVGGMAEVYLARQRAVTGAEKVVVLKRILPHLAHDSQFIEMFLQEARLAARIRHPNVVQIYDMGQNQQSYYMAMEYVEGWDLGRLLQNAVKLRRPFPPLLAARICADVAAALDAAHSALDPQGHPAPILHRDVSPHNILISREGAVKLTDFGIAKALENGRLTPTTTLKGKLAYMAPEVVLGFTAVDTRADIFSLGLVLYELLTLDRLFRRASDYATIYALLHDRIPPLSELRPDISPELDRIGLRALAREPNDRYPSARALSEDLHAYIAAGADAGKGPGGPALAEYLAQLVTDAAHVRDDRSNSAQEEQITIEY
ncbi:MAG TPA: protein kinase [Kofleriaceae bacterium]|nr:protein kinase [Kofleriaceae bacterium]